MNEIQINETKGSIVSVICKTCKNLNRHKVILSVDTNGKEDMNEGHRGEDWYYWNTSYQIIDCQGCGEISFRSEHTNSEYMDYETGENYATELIYPKRNKETWNTKDFHNIPHNLRRIYRETIDCYNNDNLTLCGAGVRALVEGLCKENGILNGEIKFEKPDGTVESRRTTNLQGKINGLHEKGKLTKENADILHEHRFLGNRAIHELSIPSKEDLSLAIEIVENVFDTLYEIPRKAFYLQSRRLVKMKKSSKS